jgi:uncharacterized repeat protein (TIGR02543 family)
VNTNSTLAWLLASALSATIAQAGNLYWDNDGAGASGTPPTSGVGGAGTWDSGTTASWWNGASYQLWNGAGGQDIADFRGTVGVVTVSGTVNVNKLNVAVGSAGSAYTITGGTVAFTGSPGILDVNAVSSFTFSSGASGNLKVNATGNAVTSGTSGGVAVMSGSPNLSSFELALATDSNPVLLDNAAGLGPATATVKLTKGVMNLSSGPAHSFNAWPTDLAGGTLRGRFGNCTWNGATSLSATSMLMARNGSGGALTFSTNATIALNAQTLSLNAGGSSSAGITINGVISGTGYLVLTNKNLGSSDNGTGTNTLGAANTFSGTATTTTGLGTLALNHVNALQNATLNTAASGSQQVTFIVPGNKTYNLGALTGADALAIGGNTISVGNKPVDTTFSGAITGSGGGVTKVGGSTLTLTAANSYSGATTVTAGTLNTTTASTGAGSYTVSSGATLGVGIAGAGQTLNASSFTLGDSTLNITLGDNNPTAAVITDSGALTLNGTVLMNVLGGASLAASDIVLLSYASGGAGIFAAGILPTVTGYTSVLTNDTSAKQLKLAFQSQSSATPTNISYRAHSGQLVLNWPAGQGWLLQAQTNHLGIGLSTNWVDVPGAVPPCTNAIGLTNGTVFYRLRQGAAPSTYVVAYNGNGSTSGTVPSDANNPYSAGATVTVLGNIGGLAKSGHTFAGWNTAANGNGTSYNPGSTFAINANTTLYAQWTPSGATYTVAYNGNGNTGGSVPADPNSPYAANATVTVLGNTGNLTNSGYVFVGWNTAANGGGTSYSPGNTFLIAANTTLFAQWSLVSSFPPFVIYDDALASGWALNGWSGTVDTANTSPVHSGSASMSFDFTGGAGGRGPCTGTYVNTANYSALSFWIHGGSGGGQSVNMQIVQAWAVGTTVNLAPLPANTWTNIVLPLSSIGLANVVNFNGIRFTSSGAMPLFYVDDVQLAGATAYTVTYIGNGNTGGSPPTDPSGPYASGATVTVLGAGNMGKLGHAFAGWNTAANGSGASYSPGSTFTLSGSTTLYAQWTPSSATYTITYNGNGNTGGTAPSDPGSPYLIGSAVTVLGNTGGLTNAGFTFTGWSTASNGVGTSYSPGSSLLIAANTTLYAQWSFVVGYVQYPYAPYNQGLMDPQLKGWPISVAESNYITTKAEYERYPGREPGGGGASIWNMVPVTPNTQSGSDGWYIRTTEVTIRPILTNRTPLDILLVGDSITSQWGGGQGGAWTTNWLNYYSNYTAVNLGIGGDRTSSVLWRLDHASFENLVSAPKVCVLQIGNNNQYLHSQGVPNAANAQGIVWCLKNLRAKFPTTPIIWVNLFPVTGTSSSTVLKEIHDLANAAGITNAASTNYVPNVHALDLWNQYASANGTNANPAFFYDGVHPNAAGYQLWATNMLPLVQTFVGH